MPGEVREPLVDLLGGRGAGNMNALLGRPPPSPQGAGGPSALRPDHTQPVRACQADLYRRVLSADARLTQGARIHGQVAVHRPA